MPTNPVTEASLLALLERVRSENNSVTATASLPDIDPNILMSAEARQEMAALTSGSVIHSSDVGGSDDSILGVLMGIAPPIDVPSEFEVDFDVDTIEGTTAPNERVRFQIGRQSPPRDYMSTNRMSQDGDVVSSRGSRGRFEPTASAPRPQPSPVTQPVTRSRPEPAPVVSTVSRYQHLKTDPFK